MFAPYLIIILQNVKLLLCNSPFNPLCKLNRLPKYSRLIIMKGSVNSIIRITLVPLIAFILAFILPQTVLAQNSPKSITFATSYWPPIAFVDNNGIGQGLYNDILQEIFVNTLGMKLEHKELPWKRVQLEVKRGVTDCFISVPTEDRLAYAVQSEAPFFLLYLYVYTYKDHPKLKEIENITSAEDIKRLGLTPVTNLGNDWHKENIDSAGVDTFYAPAEQNASFFLAKKRADIMIDAVLPTNHLLKQTNLASDIVLTKARFGPIKIHFLMSKKSPYVSLMPRINKAFNKIQKDGRLDQFLSKYNSLQ